MSSPEDQFEAYIRSTFDWIRNEPVHVRAWFLFFLVCAQRGKFRKMHAELTEFGESRIIGLMKALPLKYEKRNQRFLAKSIQRMITGGIIECCSERLPEEFKSVEEEVLKACRSLVGLP